MAAPRHAHAGRARLAPAPPDVLLIPGTSSLAHLRENLAAPEVHLADEAVAALDGIAASVGATEHVT